MMYLLSRGLSKVVQAASTECAKAQGRHVAAGHSRRRCSVRSAERYAAVRQSLGEPDPFRFKHVAALRQIVTEMIRGRADRKAATST